MRTIKNYKLSQHFTLYEFLEGIILPKKAIEMNWKNIKQCDLKLQEQLAKRMEIVRADINKMFSSKNSGKPIGLQINTGWRCKEWELYKDRSGLSQHVHAAVDVFPTNCSTKLANEILDYWEDKYWCRECGWKGGFAIGRAKPKGKYNQGFVHFDIRPNNARWYY